MKYKREEMLDLNEDNVKKLFVYCSATKNTDRENLTTISFFSANCNVNVPKLHFNQSRLEEKRFVIRYLLGQLENLHNNKKLMFLSDGFKKYGGKPWTSNKMALFSLYYLGCASQNLPYFEMSKIPNNFDTLLSSIPYLLPTLSPNDPNFEKWCRENDIVE